MQTPVQLNQQVNASRKQVLGFIRAQCYVTVFLSLVLWVVNDWASAYSAFAGGSIATLANAWFAIKVFRHNRNNRPEAVLTVFYVGEIYKFLLTASLFVVAFIIIKPVNIVVLLSVYFCVHMTPAVVNTFSRQTGKES